MKSRYIVGFHEAKQNQRYLFLILEYCNAGNLEEFLKLRGTLTEEEAVFIFYKILKGLQYLKENQVVHRDLKNENIFIKFDKYRKSQHCQFIYQETIDERFEFKIGDFGFATRLPENGLLTKVLGTPLNMAPEVLNGDSYNEKVDMWSLGVCFYEALFGETPFNGTNIRGLYINVNKGCVRVPLDKEISEHCLDFLVRCLQFDPKSRISISEALLHPLFQPFDFQLQLNQLPAIQSKIKTSLNSRRNPSLNKDLSYPKLRFNVHHSVNARSILANLEEQIEEDFDEMAIKKNQSLLKSHREEDYEEEQLEGDFDEHIERQVNLRVPRFNSKQSKMSRIPINPQMTINSIVSTQKKPYYELISDEPK